MILLEVSWVVSTRPLRSRGVTQSSAWFPASHQRARTLGALGSWGAGWSRHILMRLKALKGLVGQKVLQGNFLLHAAMVHKLLGGQNIRSVILARTVMSALAGLLRASTRRGLSVCWLGQQHRQGWES